MYTQNDQAESANSLPGLTRQPGKSAARLQLILAYSPDIFRGFLFPGIGDKIMTALVNGLPVWYWLIGLALVCALAGILAYIVYRWERGK